MIIFFLPLYPNKRFQIFLRHLICGCCCSVFSTDFEQLFVHSAFWNCFFLWSNACSNSTVIGKGKDLSLSIQLDPICNQSASLRRFSSVWFLLLNIASLMGQSSQLRHIKYPALILHFLINIVLPCNRNTHQKPLMIRSSLSPVFRTIAALKQCRKLIRKHLQWSHFSVNLQVQVVSSLKNSSDCFWIKILIYDKCVWVFSLYINYYEMR